MLLSNFSGKEFEAGCDEAGRGCLAGPVFAAAVILPKDYSNELIDDSKKLTKKRREALANIIEKDALDFAVCFCSQQEIDDINILNASFLAMHRAVDELDIKPEHLLIDGNRFNAYKEMPFDCIIKGDGKYVSIAAASILAKVYRDQYMEQLAKQFPVYYWEKNKGYPTKQHREAIKQNGETTHHRLSFQLLKPHQKTLF